MCTGFECNECRHEIEDESEMVILDDAQFSWLCHTYHKECAPEPQHQGDGATNRRETPSA